MKAESFFLSNSWIRQRHPLSPFLFNIVLEVLATAIRQEIKGIQTGLEDVCADMILYTENCMDYKQKLVDK